MMKKYEKITRNDKRQALNALNDMPDMVITEKIDGSNASFRLDNGELRVFSRRQELDEHNTLNGFYNWVVENIDVDYLENGLIYFGEWLTKHKINYSQENYKNFYLYDVYDTSRGVYLPYGSVCLASRLLNVEMAPVFYKGEPISTEEIQSLVGKSHLGAEEGEGVVVKSYGHQEFVKFVSPKFKEVKQPKNKTEKKDSLDTWLDYVLTESRITKNIHKLQDENKLPDDLGLEDMGNILKSSSGLIVEDIIEEELDVLIKEIKRKVGKRYPVKVKELLSEGKFDREN